MYRRRHFDIVFSSVSSDETDMSSRRLSIAVLCFCFILCVEKVLKGKTLPNGKSCFDGRPGAEMPPYDFDNEVLYKLGRDNVGEREIEFSREISSIDG